MNGIRRYAPDEPFPPYAHQPGQTPHPRTHPDGHSRDAPEYAGPALTEQTWKECTVYLYGVDLFNHQYYWEAHEAWEGLWKMEHRASECARFLQGLIQLAAMCIKVRAGNRRGAQKLHNKALAQLTQSERYMGMDLGALRRYLTAGPAIPEALILTA